MSQVPGYTPSPRVLDDPLLLCPMCNEPLGDAPHDISPNALFTPEGRRVPHRSCMLREVLGGIGHLVAHDYWCLQRRDPDAGLTYRQSARLVDEWVAVVGVEQAAAVGVERADLRVDG